MAVSGGESGGRREDWGLLRRVWPGVLIVGNMGVLFVCERYGGLPLGGLYEGLAWMVSACLLHHAIPPGSRPVVMLNGYQNGWHSSRLDSLVLLTCRDGGVANHIGRMVWSPPRLAASLQDNHASHRLFRLGLPLAERACECRCPIGGELP